MKPFLWFLLPVFVAAFTSVIKEERPTKNAIEYNDNLLQRVRAAAKTVPGNAPLSINYIKYAESRRPCNLVVEGGSNDTCVMARTAFQLMYPDGWIMVDAGMDRAVHHFFEKAGPQPFDDAKAASVKKAVEGARLVLITHEHGDHVAGAVHNASSNIPGKTILTRQQADALINNPMMPEIALTNETSRRYMIVDFEDILPVAPGVVLIKAPGHTKGEIMIYARLKNGKEYLFTGDVSWSYAAVAENKLKPESERKRLSEDSEMIVKQLAWINGLMTKEKITMLVSHDNIMLPQFAAKGLIKNGFK